MKAKDLKNSILQMAVQGKLVPQDPSDEPASALLERIRAERAKLIKEKKIKAPKGGESVIYLGSDGSRYEKRVNAKGRESESICIDGEIPFEIPDGWEWTRLEAVLSLASGLGYKKPDLAVKGDCMIRVYRGGNIGLGDNPAPKDNDIMISSEFVDDSLILHDGQIITPAVTSLENVGKAAFIKGADGKTVCGGFVFYLTPQLEDSTLSEYLFRYLSSPSHVGYCKANVKKSGQAFYNLSKAALNKALIPVPPLAEQRRIVERVSGLMPLVEEYGRLEDERQALDAALPDRLRKSVLQMAVEGKLVPQDPSDEPASALLDRIREERAKLIREKEIKAPKGGESVIYRGSDGRRYEKRGKGEPVCIDDEIPFDIPKGWEWARFESVLYNRDAERIPVSVAEREKLEKRYDYYGASGVIDKVDKYLFDKPLLLIGEDGANLLARTKPIAFMARGQYWVNNHAHVLDGLSEVLLEYIALFINSISLAPYVTGTAQPKMNQAKMNSILIPLPPEEEQARILKRAAELKVLVTNQ